MESLNEIKNEKINEGFFKYIFNFDDDNRAMLLNLFQYTFLSLPLVLILLKLLNYYSPEEDDKKGSLEIFIEVSSSLTVLLFAIWFINKIVRYVPTYSKINYSEFNETNFIISFLILLFTMQTKVGSKINILLNRLIDLYDGKTNLKEMDKKKDFKTMQPISHPNPVHQPSQSDFLNNHQNQNSHNHVNTQLNNALHNNGNQDPPNFNNMHAGPNTPLIDAQEPMAANEAFGTYNGGSLF